MKLLNRGLKTHTKDVCKGEHCCLHNPSDHHMAEWPIWIRMDKYTLAERICAHGVGHPDPDSLEFLEKYPILQDGFLRVHGCDGCCSKEASNAKR